MAVVVAVWVLAAALVLCLGALVTTLRLLADARREAEHLQETVESQLVETRNPRAVQAAGKVVTKVVEAAARAREHGVGRMVLASIEDFTRWAAEQRTVIGRMASALQGESQVVRRALEDQGRERRRAEFAMEEAVNSRARWRMVFDQSPLPQSCFDASRLHRVLRPHIEAGETHLGDVARVLFACSSETLPFIALGESNEAAEMLLAPTHVLDA